MRKVAEVAEEFLAHKRIAVTGVSRSPADHGANVVYKRRPRATARRTAGSR